MTQIGIIKKAAELGYKGYGRFIWHACRNIYDRRCEIKNFTKATEL